MNLKNHKRKMVGPIVVTAIVIVYYAIYFGILITLLSGTWKYVLGIVPIVLAAVMLAVCIERIKEIRSGEEDDLSKY
ncbi:MAG: hypothetical protein ACI4EL_00490 [Candidatus Fimimorpha sp.]